MTILHFCGTIGYNLATIFVKHPNSCMIFQDLAKRLKRKANKCRDPLPVAVSRVALAY